MAQKGEIIFDLIKLLIAANPGQVNLVSPAEIDPALRARYDRAVKEADRVKAFLD
jgi:hypothetical protein